MSAAERLERFRLVATRANGQPAFARYLRTREGPLRAYGLMVLTVGGDRVTAVTGFPTPACSPASAYRDR